MSYCTTRRAKKTRLVEGVEYRCFLIKWYELGVGWKSVRRWAPAWEYMKESFAREIDARGLRVRPGSVWIREWMDHE